MDDQHLFNLNTTLSEPAEGVRVTPNIWLLTSEEVPPILFTPEEVARLLGVGRSRVYDLIRLRELRSVKVGCSRRISARALSDYVTSLELGEPA
jgi:excisionase family DNA binding protein